MFVAWIIISSISLILLAIIFCNDRFIGTGFSKFAWFFFLADCIFTIVTAAICHRWYILPFLILIVGLPFLLPLIIDNVKNHQGIFDQVAEMLVLFGLVIGIFAALGGFKPEAAERKTPRTYTETTERKTPQTHSKTNSTSNSNSQGTGTNKRPVDEYCVYWVPGGEVWHSWAGCSSLRNSDTIYSGSIYEAEEAGKYRGCYLCTDE